MPVLTREPTVKKYASSVDVARMAGVSQSAVSRTFSGATNVSEGTRKKVLEAAKRLDYRPSLIPAHHADPQIEPGRDRRRRPLQSVLFGRARAIHGQVPGVRPSGPAGACRQRSRPGRGHPQACQLSGRRDRQRPGNSVSTRGADAGQAEDPGDFLQHRREERMGHAGVVRQYRGGPHRSPICSSPEARARSASFRGPSQAMPAPAD